jgi:hypothetical protein
VNAKVRKKLARRKRRIQKRLDQRDLRGCSRPMLTASNIRYEIGARGRGIGYGGIGAMHLLVRKLGLAEAIDRRLHLLQIHLPYHESDHVLNLAYNALCDGTCLEDIELRRNDEVFLDTELPPLAAAFRAADAASRAVPARFWPTAEGRRIIGRSGGISSEDHSWTRKG